MHNASSVSASASNGNRQYHGNSSGGPGSCSWIWPGVLSPLVRVMATASPS